MDFVEFSNMLNIKHPLTEIRKNREIHWELACEGEVIRC